MATFAETIAEAFDFEGAALAKRVETAPEPEKPARAPAQRAKPKPAKSGDALTDFIASRQGKALQRQIMRGVFGMIRKRL